MRVVSRVGLGSDALHLTLVCNLSAKKLRIIVKIIKPAKILTARESTNIKRRDQYNCLRYNFTIRAL